MNEKSSQSVERLIEKHYRNGLEEQISSKSLQSRIIHSIQGKSTEHSIERCSKRRFWFAVAGAVAIISALIIRCREEPLGLQFLSGDSLVLIDETERDLKDGSIVLYPGGELNTWEAQVQLGMPNGVTLIADAHTRICYVAKDVIKLKSGRLYYRHNTSHESTWNFVSEFGKVVPVGTEFDLEITDTLTINVYKGDVDFEAAWSVHHIRSGESINVNREEKAIIAKIPSNGQRWWNGLVSVPWTEYVKQK